MSCVCIIAYAIVLHLTWAAALAVSGDAGFTTAAILGHQLLGFAFPALLAISALCGSLCLDRSLPARWFVIAAVPQQAFLTLSAVAAGTAIYQGAFPDGVIRSTYFLLVDQAPALLAAVFHAVAIIAGYAERHKAAASAYPHRPSRQQ